MTREMKQEFTLRITQANKTQLITILYEMVLLYIDEAQEALEKEDKTAFRSAIRKIRGCMNELTSSLNFEYEIAQNLKPISRSRVRMCRARSWATRRLCTRG